MSGRPQIETAETLARKASGDALVAEKLAPHDDIGDGAIGLWAQQAVRWVAIRDGKIVASDLSLSALRRRPEVERSDALMPVPRSRPGSNRAMTFWASADTIFP